VNIVRPWTVLTNEGVIISAASREHWRSSRDIVRQLQLKKLRVLEVLVGDRSVPHHFSPTALLSPDSRLVHRFYVQLRVISGLIILYLEPLDGGVYPEN